MQILHGAVCRFDCMLSCEGKTGRGGGSTEIGLAYVARFIKSLTSFKPKCLIFPTLFTLGPQGYRIPSEVSRVQAM